MLKSSLLILLILLSASSCSKHATPKLLISEWEKKYQDSKVIERKLANAPDGQCLKDIFSVDLLKEEIKALEKNYPQSDVKGSWRHINLSAIPAPQANFLKRYGDMLGDVTGKTVIDYSSCKDVPCIYNKIYGDDNFVGGYVHYLWYLRLGHMLSADNHIPTQDISRAGVYQGKAQNLSKYLYSEKELYGMWRLSLMLKSSHNKLTNLNEIQRIPTGEYLEGRSKMACGVAYSLGHIVLKDDCLTIYTDKDEGALYGSVAHELSHMMDFGLKDISEEDEYRKLSGFLSYTLYENEKKETVKRWNVDPKVPMISEYAKFSPMENFAETLAYFRVEGEGHKTKVGKEHWSHVSSKYYGGNEFHRSRLMEAWLNKNSLDLSKEALKMVADCTAPEADSPKSTFFRTSDFQVKILPSILNCLGSRAEVVSNSLKSKIAATEPEGCSYLKWDGVQIWNESSKKTIALYLNQFLSELESDKNYLSRINAFYDELSNPSSARMAYLNCYKSDEEESCYKSEVNKLTLVNASSLNLPDAHTTDLINNYQEFHPYLKTKLETADYYSQLIATQRNSISMEASRSFNECLSLPLDDSESPRRKLFSLGEGYLISSVYNCLGDSLPDSVRGLVRGMEINGKTVEHPQEEVLLFNEIKPIYLNELAGIYNLNRSKEQSMAKQSSAQLTQKIRSALTSDFKWIKEILNSARIVSDCEKEALSKIEILPIYHLKRDLYQELLVSGICQGLETSPEFEKYLQNSKSSLIEKAQGELEEKLLSLAQRQAEKCVAQYPVDSNMNRLKFKKEREACLIDPWPRLEAEVIRGFEEDPLVKKFNLNSDIIKIKFDQTRRRNQIRIFKDYF